MKQEERTITKINKAVRFLSHLIDKLELDQHGGALDQELSEIAEEHNAALRNTSLLEICFKIIELSEILHQMKKIN